MRVARISCLFFIVLALVACASFTTNAYKTLAVSQQTYDVTLSTLGDLYKAGKLTDAQKDKAIALGGLYKKSHNEAVSALLLYDASDVSTQEKAKQAYLMAAADAAKRLADLIEYAKPFLGGK